MNAKGLGMLAGLLLALLGGSAWAESAAEIAKLAEKGLGEEVLMAAVERSDGFELSADDIIRLKEAKVPDNVIAAMLRKKPGAAKVAASGDVQIVAEGAGTLNLENVDDRPWAYRLDGATRTLWISPAGEGNQKTLNPHGGVSLAVNSGAYTVRYAGEASGEGFNVPKDQKALLLFSRVETAEFEGLYVSIFEKGERRGGGRLAVLRQTRKPDSGATYRRVETDTTYSYQQPQTTTQTTERVVERVVEPSTTVIYRSYPSYYYDDCYSPYSWGYRPYYYGGWYGGWYGHRYHRHRSGVSVGIGFGF